MTTAEQSFDGCAGDRPALLRQVLDRHAAALVLYARQWCDRPEDVVQEALVKLAGAASLPERVLHWLYRVVRNGAISAARSDRRRREHEAAAAAPAGAWFEPDAARKVDAGTVAEALTGLPIEQREAITAHLWGGLAFEAVGELMGCSSSSAHRHYLAGLAELRKRLGDQ